jgi:c-di-GMP-binding flagellar brake protein YcgR
MRSHVVRHHGLGSFGTLPPILSTLEVGRMTDVANRRRRPRVVVPAAYAAATLRVVGQRGEPLMAHVLNLAEGGMAVEADGPVEPGTPLTVELCIPGLGRLRNDCWPVMVAAGQVVRVDVDEDLPQGPVRLAVRFERISTMTQAHIARFVASQEKPGASARIAPLQTDA